MNTAIKPQTAYLTLISNPNPIKSYIDIRDLLECVQLLYAAKLDDVPENLAETLYLPIQEWYENSLRGQLDAPSLKKALYSLQEVYSASVEYHFTQDPHLESTLKHYFLQDDRFSGSFEDWLAHLFTISLERLSRAVHQLI
ncbi:MAG TPA: hypothetical protein V6D10_17600 [Trichocoleus sp.]|jgi:hypothetical protein